MKRVIVIINEGGESFAKIFTSTSKIADLMDWMKDTKTVTILDDDDSSANMQTPEDLLLAKLDEHNGNRRKAAMDLGISERTLYRRIKEIEK